MSRKKVNINQYTLILTNIINNYTQLRILKNEIIFIKKAQNKKNN